MSAPLEMNPEIRARWTAALRSGEYQQGQGCLRDYEDKFCCLGVLSDLAAKDGIIEASQATGGTHWRYGIEISYLPEAVRRWAELTESNPNIDVGSLAMLNDDGTSFAFIADLIDGGAA